MVMILISFLLINFLSSSSTQSFYHQGYCESLRLSPGFYHFLCNGGQGGSGFDDGTEYNIGGPGATVEGDLQITDFLDLLVCVGGQGRKGKSGDNAGGFNGGGKSGKDTDIFTANDGSGGGGGATDFRIQNDVSTRIIVAAGGSGAAGQCNGAPGGAREGKKCVGKNSFSTGSANQDNGGTSNGIGQNGADDSGIPGSGAGGGYRGGLKKGTAGTTAACPDAVSESGSSFISGDGKTVSGLAFTNTIMLSGTNIGQGSASLTTYYTCPSHCRRSKIRRTKSEFDRCAPLMGSAMGCIDLSVHHLQTFR